jgi:hypothetical protein
MTITFEPDSDTNRRRRWQEDQQRKAEAEARGRADARRVERQRTLFAMLPDTRSVDALKAAMLNRARELLAGGDGDDDTRAAWALLEFLPSRDVDRLLKEVFPED